MKTQREIYEQWYAKLKADPERLAEHRRKNIEKNRKWRESNPDKSHEAQRKWREVNAEKKRDDDRQWREANQERIVEYNRQYRADNQKIANERTRKWRQSNRERVTEYQRERVKANLGQFRQYNRKRRASKLSAPGFHTEEEFQALCSYYMDQCLACGDIPDKLTEDHVIPLVKGGSDDISNIQPLCKSCNCSKGAKTINYRT